MMVEPTGNSEKFEHFFNEKVNWMQDWSVRLHSEEVLVAQ